MYSWQFSKKIRPIANYLLKMSKCELSLKVLSIANFYQITHSPTFGTAFTW